MIEIQQLQFFYDDMQVLFDIDLKLEKNTITGLIGPNGAGKSTLMRCIAGLEIPRQGKVLLEGIPILDNPQKSYTQIGYLPDIFGLTENLTVLQNWAYAAKAHGIEDHQIKEHILTTAELLGLSEKLSHKISQLSRGQKQRVGIGQVIIHRPKLLILDEPASGLDPEARYELSQLFNLLRKQGMTLLISSHILSELDEYCTHMLVIQEGKIKQYQALQHHNSNSAVDHCAEAISLVLHFSHLSEAEHIIIQNAPDIEVLSITQHQVNVSIAKEHKYRVELIRYLVQHELPLIGVEPLKETLLQSYRNSLDIGK